MRKKFWNSTQNFTFDIFQRSVKTTQSFGSTPPGPSNWVPKMLVTSEIGTQFPNLEFIFYKSEMNICTTKIFDKIPGVIKT